MDGSDPHYLYIQGLTCYGGNFLSVMARSEEMLGRYGQSVTPNVVKFRQGNFMMKFYVGHLKIMVFVWYVIYSTQRW